MMAKVRRSSTGSAVPGARKAAASLILVSPSGSPAAPAALGLEPHRRRGALWPASGRRLELGEAGGEHGAGVERAVLRLHHHAELLHLAAAERGDDQPAGPELVDEGRRRPFGGGGDEDAVERRMVGPAAIAVAGTDLDVAI